MEHYLFTPFAHDHSTSSLEMVQLWLSKKLINGVIYFNKYYI